MNPLFVYLVLLSIMLCSSYKLSHGINEYQLDYPFRPSDEFENVIYEENPFPLLREEVDASENDVEPRNGEENQIIDIPLGTPDEVIVISDW